MDRRKFLKTGGSIALAVVAFATVGTYVWKMFTNPGKLFYDTSRKRVGNGRDTENKDFASPYRLTGGFLAQDEISAFDIADEKIVVATQNNISIYSIAGNLINNYAIKSDVRDISYYDGLIYMLFSNRIEAIDLDGNTLKKWDACSETSDYSSLTVFDGGVFVTDASDKIVVKYNLDGTLARFIKSPEGFVVPSYSFGITNNRGMVYCSNPGRHKIEVYDADGNFISSFGKSGTEAGQFSGCCNPVQLATTNAGEILTSEKGIPRISCYATDGTFRSVLLNAKMLGGGHEAYDMRVSGDKLIVAGKNKIQIFQYNNQLAELSLCGSCTADCPMKTF